jgi:hypothetical protein
MQFLLPGADAVSARRGGGFYRESYDFAQPCGLRGKTRCFAIRDNSTYCCGFLIYTGNSNRNKIFLTKLPRLYYITYGIKIKRGHFRAFL